MFDLWLCGLAWRMIDVVVVVVVVNVNSLIVIVALSITSDVTRD